MDTANDQMVARNDEGILVLNPKRVMTPQEAVRHACWLLLTAGATRDQIREQLTALENT